MKLWAIVPELVLAGACLLLVPAAAWVRKRWRWLPFVVAATALVACTAMSAVMLAWEPVRAFQGSYSIDGLASASKLVLCGAALISLATFAPHFAPRSPGDRRTANAPVALLFATLGAVGLVSSNDLGLIVLFLQMMSMGGYVLIVLERDDERAFEAVLKYFLYAAVALAVMAYGLTFFYGLTGSLGLDAIGRGLVGADRVWVAAALVLVLVGYGFEIAIVPLHVWAPDTFAGASAPVSGFLSVVPKAAAVLAWIRFATLALPGEAAGWPWYVAVAAVLSMSLGNLVALRQTRLKRLLAWSSIAQAGYILATVVVTERTSSAPVAAAFYLAVYAFMNLAAFAVAAQIERATGGDEIVALRGLGRRNPVVAAVLALALLSLAGIPPLAGYAGKVLVLTALFEGSMSWLAIVAAANMVVGLAYYVRITAEMYLREPTERTSIPGSMGYAPGYALCTLGTIGIGIVPYAALTVLDSAAEAF